MDSLMLSLLAAICIGPLTVAFLLGFGCGVWMARRGGRSVRPRTRGAAAAGAAAARLDAEMALVAHMRPYDAAATGVPDDEQVARMVDGATLARLHTLRLRWQGRGARQH